ncbi:MAG TPA: hypothetical protein VLW83_05640, partial [Candidatus Acidoferrales bacterium]|nr:hypothetical protein [Candidatus Acidoferrales bacterium]
QSKGGTSTVCEKRVPSEDVRIDDFDGGRLLDHLTDDGKLLASVWKGCSLASSHATNCHHPSVSDQDVLPKALAIIVKHLQDTIYQKAGKELRDYVLERV